MIVKLDNKLKDMSRVFRIRVIKDSLEDVKSYFNTITFFLLLRLT